MIPNLPLSFNPASAIFIVLMPLVAIWDFRRLRIPNPIILISAATGMAIAGFESMGRLGEGMLAGACSLGLLAAIRFTGNALLKKESMGIGDLKLAGVIGLFAGFVPFLVALWVASVMGMIYAFVPRTHVPSPPSLPEEKGEGGMSRYKKIPFGAFLALSSIVVLLFKRNILYILQSWSWLTLIL
jgi:leader peptidase (prepilin peptidase)/N-methyltransferase